MTAVVFYFQIHQPYRLKRYTFFDIGRNESYFDDTENERILRRVAEKCYLPMNALLAELVDRHEGRFRFAMALTGTVLGQMESWCPEALESFQALARTGCVEIVCETSHHSLSFLEDPAEFELQVELQRQRIRELFGQDPVTFRCTELVVDNAIAKMVEDHGFKAILGEGADHLLGFKSSHQVYRPAGCDSIKLLLRTYQRADDIAFRFSNRSWDKWPLTADAFAKSLDEAPPDAVLTGLFMDYETFGEHQWRETGIFEFMKYLPTATAPYERLEFKTPAEVAETAEAVEVLDIPHPVSWADQERDLSAWLGNHMQRAANRALYDLAPDVLRAAEDGHEELLEDWRRLTTSDHVYYMCTKWFSDGDVHKYFSPYTTPHDAFIAFMNVLADLRSRVHALLEPGREVAPLAKPPVETRAGPGTKTVEQTQEQSARPGHGRTRTGR